MIQDYSQVYDWLIHLSAISITRDLIWQNDPKKGMKWGEKREEKAKLGRRAVSAVVTVHGGEQRSFMGKFVLGTQHRRRADRQIGAHCPTNQCVLLPLLTSLTWILVSV